MVPTELTARPQTPVRGPLLPAGLPHAWVYAYAAVWAVTLLCAALSRLAGIGPWTVLHPTAPPTLTAMLATAAHNIPIACAPVFLGVIYAHRHQRLRTIADVLISGSLTVNSAIVGATAGIYGLPLLAYIPQLPIEWAALALGAAAWITERKSQGLPTAQRLLLLAVIIGLLLAAASLETWAVPHR